MQTIFDYTENECPWYYFDSSYKVLMGACLVVFGVFGVLLNGWLFATFVHSHLLVFKSHVLVLNLCSASFGRNLLGFPFAGSSAIAKRWLFGPTSCQLYAFLHQFFAVFQITALFCIVLERYLLAKFYKLERCLYFKYYWTLLGVCWVNSVVFSAPPLFGYGVYSCDSTGTSCSLLWPSLDSGAKQLGFSVPYVIVCGLIPVVGIFYYMGKAVRLEKIYYRGPHLKDESRFTKTVHVLTVITLALWIPAAVLAGWQWLPVLLYGYRPHVPQVLAIVAPISAEAATSVPVLCYLVGDDRLRAALIGRMQKQYALLHPKYARKYQRDMY
ncbi:visual pigment-like receptor peropsin [Aricia agestis]|uniref:visual pigment-like receptor peropsin n=1 Tax=Aricia agestis TaxID=91739 RepID=UPI001C2082EF|nr:visual pigment-like receptor peropsin [Aricia agestis]